MRAAWPPEAGRLGRPELPHFLVEDFSAALGTVRELGVAAMNVNLYMYIYNIILQMKHPTNQFHFPSGFLPYNNSVVRMNINKKRTISRVHDQSPHLWKASDGPVQEDKQTIWKNACKQESK